MNILSGSPYLPRIFRKFFYQIAGLNIDTSYIAHGSYFKTNLVSIGKGTFINHNCYFDNLSLVEIGENCNIAMDVMFCTSTHMDGNELRRAGTKYSKPIKIGKGCWIGARVIITPGVSIGEGCIIGAGSVVTKDCNPNILYAGTPAQKIKVLPISNTTDY